MKSNFLTFQRFNSSDLASPVIDVLKENDIPYELEEDKLSFDPSNLSGNSFPIYLLKIPSTDFEKVNTLLLKANANVEIDEQHYLNSFTDAELMEILLKPDEWSRTDYNLAHVLLKRRGKEVNDALLESLRKQRIDDLSQPENAHTWISVGYFAAICGGLLGVFTGFHLWTSKKTLPNGQRVYHFKKEDRKQGLCIFITGIICTIFWLTIRILAE